MRLASGILKLDVIGTNIPFKDITPGEALLLCCLHHVNAGGDPILILEESDKDEEKEPIKVLKEEIKQLEVEFEGLDLIDLTDEIREKRSKVFRQKIQAKQDALHILLYRQARRSFTAGQERDRLVQKYGVIKVKKVYPERIPTFPETFEEARQMGVSVDAPTNQEDPLLTFGG